MIISIIGYGHISKAICQGLLSNQNFELQVSAPSLTTALSFSRLSTHSDNLAIVPDAQILILAVKPAQMATVLTEISPHLQPSCLVISLAAGLDLSWFSEHLPEKTPLVRAMPNLAAACNQSATPLFANQWVNPQHYADASAVFKQCGQVSWLQCEEDLDIITALSGSGLAYLFLFAQAMSESAITLGLNTEVADSFTLQTLNGAASLASQPDQNFAGLLKKITSEAGTTAAALAVFTQHHLTNTVLTAMQAAVARSKTLRKEET